MAGCVIIGEQQRSLELLRSNGARAARGLAGMGIGPTDRVAVLLRNGFERIEAAYAASHLGAYLVAMNWRSAAPEIAYIIADSGAKALVADSDLHQALAQQIDVHCPVLLVGSGDRAEWSNWLKGFEPWDKPAPPPVGAMIYTSGTTGRPKGVRRHAIKPESRAGAQRVLDLVFGLGDGIQVRTVITGPLYHSSPNQWAVASARADAHIVIQPRFDAEVLLQLIETHRITHLQLVPTMLWRLLKLPAEMRRRYDVSSLRFVAIGAAACPPDVKAAMIDWWGPVIHEFYGATETGPVTFATSQDAIAKPGTVGRAIDGAVIVAKDSQGRTLPAGEVGELYMRQTYWPEFDYFNNAEARAGIERDGLITAGDLGIVDADGHVFIVGRVKDMIVSGGANIYPAEIEAAIVTHPGVADAAVVGVPDPEYGEIPVAFIEPRAGVELGVEDVKGWLSARIARTKMPRRFEFRDALPREDSGKIFKNRLRQEIGGGGARVA